ncbi:transcription initiation factor TFIID subunit A-domain-containing protein [Crepidotus variabilis]|uniref:TBP-associated factor 12 n=1 Tax=Crepidotus variabilis TaxID=179855 RepID=A0A9P6JVQ6_9AGAR|nr:transcription initiation factor TFIID subunit A-domain-containing protein [Crepidotus variabilis]
MSESTQPAASSSTSQTTNTGAAAAPTAGTASAASGQTASLVAEATPEIFNALRNLIMTQTGGPVSNDKVSNLLLANMTTLVSQGKLTQKQILLLKDYADSTRITTGAAPISAVTANTLKAAAGATTSTATGVAPGIKASTSSGSNTPATAPTPTTSSSTSTAHTTTNSNLPTLQSSVDFYPAISATLNTTNPGPVQWAQTRPTLTGGVPSGRLSGTPAQVARPLDDPSMLVGDDAGVANGANGGAGGKRRKSTPGDQSMRRTIQDLVASVDPNVKIEPEVEDLLLSIADEFIDSVTNFSCRLAKHRGGDALEVRDLQLHLERNHNIRIPGFASDETRISLSQNNLGALAAAVGGTGGGTGKKGAQGGNMTLRAQRLAQVQQAKREGKLM